MTIRRSVPCGGPPLRRPGRCAAAALLSLLLAPPLSGPAYSQDFEPIDLEAIERLLEGLEPLAPPEEPVPFPGTEPVPDPAPDPIVVPGPPVQPPAPPAPPRGRTWRPDDPLEPRLRNAPRRSAASAPWFYLRVAGDLAFMQQRSGSYGRFPGIPWSIDPRRDGGSWKPNLSYNPSQGRVAWFDAEHSPHGDPTPAVSAAADIRFARGFQLGLGYRHRSEVRYDVSFNGEVPVRDAYYDYDDFNVDFAAFGRSQDRFFTFRAGWRFEAGPADVYLVAAPGLLMGSFDAVDDADGPFYARREPCGLFLDCGDPEFAVAVGELEPRRAEFGGTALPVLELSAGVVRWVGTWWGVGAEAAYLRPLAEREVPRIPNRTPLDGSVENPNQPFSDRYQYRYRPHSWSLSFGFHTRF